MRYGDVRKVLRLCSLFTIFAVQKPRKKSSQVFKESVASDNCFSLFELHVKLFHKIVS